MNSLQMTPEQSDLFIRPTNSTTAIPPNLHHANVDLPNAAAVQHANNIFAAHAMPPSAAGATTNHADMEEDNLSQVTMGTEQLSLSGSPPTKRQKSKTGTYVTPSEGTVVHFFTQLASTYEGIVGEVHKLLQDLNLSPTIATSIAIESVYPRGQDTQAVSVTISDTSACRVIVATINKLWNEATPSVKRGPPPTADLSSLDVSPTTQMPAYCRVLTCPHNNAGHDCFPTVAEASHHGRHFHSHLFRQADDDALANIHWFRCVPSCRHLSFGAAELNEHQLACPIYAEYKPPAVEHPLAAELPPPDPYAMIRTLCPDAHVNDLELAIAAQEPPDSLQIHLLNWLMEAKSTAGTNGSS